MARIAFISTTFANAPAEYQGAHDPEEPLDLLYAISACAGLGTCRLIDPTSEADEEYLRWADAIVFSTTTSYLQWNNHPLGLDLFRPLYRRARDINPHAKRVVIGPHVPAHWEDLRAMGADAVLLGEAELEIASTVDALLAGRRPSSPSLMDGNNLGVRAAVVENLDTLPIPAYAESVRSDYLAHNGPDAMRFGHLYETSRGCPYFCSFCNTVTHRRSYRTKSPQRIARDLGALHDVSRHEYVYLIDESFGFKRDWFDQVMPVLRDAPFSFGCQGNLKFISEEKLDVMAASGFVSMEFGFETANEAILRAIGKNNRLGDAQTVLNYAASVGVQPLLFVLIGLPGENAESLGRTCEFFRGLDPRCRISVGMPTPYIGTKLHAMGVASGIVDPDAVGKQLYTYTGTIGHDLTFDRAEAAQFLSTYGPNGNLTDDFVAQFENDVRALYGIDAERGGAAA